MKLDLCPKSLLECIPSIHRLPLLTTAALSIVGAASGATVGVNFLNGNNIGNTNLNALAATDVAGAGTYAQSNWNNLASYPLPAPSGTGTLGVGNTNIALIDSSGASAGVLVSWAASGTWSQNGNPPTAQASPDANLMNAYLDTSNNGNTNLNPNIFLNGNGNRPLVYFSGISTWLAGQGASYYDVIIYADGDSTGGRVGEYWLTAASGPPDGLTVGSDITTHVFICDRTNFISTPSYANVPLTSQIGHYSQIGNFAGDYAVFDSLTGDSFILRDAEFATRCVINAIQIIPRVTPLAPIVAPQAPTGVIAGSNAVMRATVGGRAPMTFQWLKAGSPLSDVGNISGSQTLTLTVSNVSAGDVGSYSLVVTNPLGVTTSAITTLSISAPVSGSFAEKILTNGPYAYWRFNDNVDPSTGFAVASDYAGGYSGTYGRASLNGFNSVAGPQPTDFPGFESGNSGLQSALNIRSSWVVAPPLNMNTNTATFCCWIFPTAAQAGFTSLIGARNGNDTADLGFGNNNNLGYTWNSNNAATYNFVSGLVPPTNQWSFVALTISSTNGILYIYNTNGQFTATNAIAHTVEALTGFTCIGSDDGQIGRTFQGTIDEVAVFNRTLPDTELYLLFKKGLGVGIISASVATPPINQVRYTGRNATFTVVGAGDKPLNYQWRTNGVNLVNGGRISGANSATLIVSNVVPSDSGSYDVVVDNVAHTPVASAPATLTVVDPPSPLSGYEAALQAVNPTHYWRFNEPSNSPYAYDYWGGNIATNDNAIAGQPIGPQPPTFPGFETTNSANSYDGLTMATETGMIGLMNNLSQFSIIGWFNTAGIIGQRIGLFGQNDVAEFGFHALGSDNLAQLGIFTAGGGSAFLNQSLITAGQWYFTAAVGNGMNMNLFLFTTNGSGGFVVNQSTTVATTTNYGISAYPFNIGGDGVLDPTGNYFTGLIDEVATFNRALSVGELANLFAVGIGVSGLPPQITTQPGSQTLYAGRNAAFHVVAIGSSPLTYSWRTNGVALSDVGNVYGSSTADLTISNSASINIGNYDCVIANGAGSITSSVASLNVITPLVGGFEAASLALNPLAYWRLNETNGSLTAFDFWGGHNGTYQVAASNGVPGVPNPPFVGLETNNLAVETFVSTVNSFVSVPPGSIGTNTVTFTAWLYPIGVQENWSGLLVTRGAAISGGFNYNDQQMLGYTWNNNNQNTWGFASGLVPPTNQWSFVAVAISPTNAILYLYDGTTLQTATNAIAHTPDVMGNNWQIGHDNSSGNNDGTRTFNGIIDEVALYLKTLSPSQIQQLYSSSGILVKLNILLAGPNVVLTWPHGTLLEAPDVTGPWSTNNATSPYTNAPSADRKFYKVIER